MKTNLKNQLLNRVSSLGKSLQYTAAASSLALSSANAAPYYWNTTTTNLWQTGANWSDDAATGGTTGTVPLSTDSAVFNQSSVNGIQVVQLNAAATIAGLTFNNTGTTTLQSDTTTTRVLNIASGMTVGSGAGNVIFGVTNALVTPTVTASQTWTNNSTVGAVTVPTGTLAMGANTLTLAGAGNFSFNTVTATVAGIMDATQTGSLSLAAASANFLGVLNTGQNGGTLLLNVGNLLTGVGATVNIKGGTIASSTGAARALAPATSVTADFALGQASGGTGVATLSGAMNLNAAIRQITVNNASDIISGVISNGGITKAGTGILALSNLANAYTGNTTINAGTLLLTNSGAGSATSAITVSNLGSTLAVNYGGVADYTQAQVVTLLGKTTFSTSATTLAFDTTNASGTYATNLNMAAGLTKLGVNTLTLSAANTYSGATTISAGTLELADSQAMQNSALNTTGSAAGGAAVGLKTTVPTLTLGGLTGNKALAAVFTTTAGGYGTVTALTLNPGTGTSNSYSAILADGAAGMAVNKTGAGTQALTGLNTYTGTTTLSAGTLQINSNSTGAVGAVTAGNVGTGTLALNGGTLSTTSTASRTLLNAVTVGGNVTLGDATNNGTLIFSAGIDLGGSARTLTTASVVNLDGNVINGSIIKDGSGTLRLGGANTFSGFTISAGTATINGPNVGSVGAITSSSIGTGTLTFNGGSISSATGSNRVILNAVTFTGNAGFGGVGAGTLAFGAAADLGGATRTLTTVTNTTFSGIVSNGGLTKDGASSTLSLTAANTYAGDTTVTAGTLSLGNGTANSTLADASGVVIGTDPSAVLNLNYSGTDNVASLTINGVAKPAGIYGSSDPSGRITGTGTLTVGAVASPYDTWASTFLPGNNVSNPTGDNDNDGLVNQQEFAYGLSPISGSSVSPILVQLDKTTGQFTYQRRAATGLTYTIQKSTTLAADSWSLAGASQVAGAVDGNGNQTVVVTLPGAPLTDANLFVRVSAE